MVMGKNGGVFPVLSRLAKLGLGGKQGNGKQYVSWIHEEDFVRIVLWIIEHDEFEGTINCTAPFPILNTDFMATLRKKWKLPFGLPSPKVLLEIGALFLRTETELVLKSRRVVPKRLLKAGFKFNYPQAEDAIQTLIHQTQYYHEK